MSGRPCPLTVLPTAARIGRPREYHGVLALTPSGVPLHHRASATRRGSELRQDGATIGRSEDLGRGLVEFEVLLPGGGEQRGGALAEDWGVALLSQHEEGARRAAAIAQREAVGGVELLL